MKENKGFTLIELLVVIAIIGVLSSVILESIQSAKCKENPKGENCKIEQVQKESTQEDKFRSIETESSTQSFVTKEFPCLDVGDIEARSECERETYKSKMIEQCIKTYTN
jgi:prepilin-type N-terminal cleavage/methylation domain-containing protein